MAEDYCAGMTLDRELPGAGISFGMPLSSDSLLGTAIGHFDSALADAYGVDSVTYLASVGLGRAWLDRGQFDKAAQAVAAVPTSFAYNVTNASQSNTNGQVAGNLGMNFYTNQVYQTTQCCGYCVPGWNTADREGSVGMDFISGNDRRLAFTNGGYTCDYVNWGLNGQEGTGLTDSTFMYPLKFGLPGQSVDIPIATGVEAALITAETALSGSAQSASQMLADLQQLRQNSLGASTYLQLDTAVAPMTSDSLNAEASEAVAILFRERAFWLFGTGTRLGDMRREVRHYGGSGGVLGANAVNLVYPNGPYAQAQMNASIVASNGNLAPPLYSFQQYGNDIVMPLPTPAYAAQFSNGYWTSLNPHYAGCTTTMTQP